MDDAEANVLRQYEGIHGDLFLFVGTACGSGW